MDNKKQSTSALTLVQLFYLFLKFGFLAWGGPVAQIAMIKDELVLRRAWIPEEKFNRILGVYQALPGPEAHELCCYFGFTQHGRLGSVIAGLGFMLPGFIFMLILSSIYVRFGTTVPILIGAFSFMQPAVTALIVKATHKLGGGLVKSWWQLGIAISALLCALIQADFWIALGLGGVAGVMGKAKPKFTLLFLAVSLILVSALSLDFKLPTNFNAEETIRVPATWYSTLLLGLKAGLLTFGGAYTAIPFIQHDAVVLNQWLSMPAFLDGIALAGTIPAPLVIFSTFVGFISAGWVGALALTAGMFLPAFSFTLFGHSLLEKLIENEKIHGFLDGLTAAVVGMIGYSAIGLFISNCLSPRGMTIFLISLAVLFSYRSAFAIPAVMVGAGCLGLISQIF